MKILRSWLADYLKTNISNEELADVIVSLGSDIDEIKRSFDDRVIVAKILSINSHPNADRLRIVKVTTGSEEYDIVCGAPNIEVGQTVPFALVGAKLGDHVLEKATIRGIESNGMLCAEDELGLGPDHSGIKILDNSFKAGDPLSKYIKPEVVFDLEITPNRGDLLSHLGMARDLAATLKQNVTNNDTEKTTKDSHASELKINIEDKENCNQYYGVILSSITVSESPDWLKNRLAKCGMRPINNIVDATNYVMLDLGQPLHAFDSSKVKDGEIIIRKAEGGEKIPTLDGQTRNLESGMLVIADKEKPLAIAGIMGGADSEVNDSTTELILEAAQFNPKSIRATAKKLGISSEASYRFERGIDPLSVDRALRKTAALILELAGGRIGSEIVFAGEKPQRKIVGLNRSKIRKMLGLDIADDEIDQILISLGFEIENNECYAPSWRHDISIIEDLAEEVARITGYRNVPQTAIGSASRAARGNYYKKELIKDILVENGFSEVINYPFLSQKDLESIGIDPNELLVVVNPVNSENKYLRKSLLPGLLKSIAKNPSFDPVLIFEIGQVFSEKEEETNLAIAAVGKDAEKLINSALGAIETMTGLSSNDFNARLLTQDELARYKIRKSRVLITEIAIPRLIENLKVGEGELTLKITNKPIRYRAISKYPSVVRDVAFIIDRTTHSDDLKKEIYNTSEMINRVELFDEFVSDKIGIGKKNVAYHLDLQHQDRTLTDREANEIVNRAVEAVEQRFGARLRE